MSSFKKLSYYSNRNFHHPRIIFIIFFWYVLKAYFNSRFYYVHKYLHKYYTEHNNETGQKTVSTLTGHKTIFTTSKWTKSSSKIKFIELYFQWLFIHLLTRPNDTPNSPYKFSAQIRTFWLVWQFWPFFRLNHENFSKRKLFGTSWNNRLESFGIYLNDFLFLKLTRTLWTESAENGLM